MSPVKSLLQPGRALRGHMSPGSSNTTDLRLPPSPPCWQSQGVSPHSHLISFHPNRKNYTQALLRSVFPCLTDKFWGFCSNEGPRAAPSWVSALAFRGLESTKSASSMSLGSPSSLRRWDRRGSPWAAWVDVGLTHHREPKTLPPPASKAEMPPEKSSSLPHSPVVIHPRQPQRGRRSSQAAGGGTSGRLPGCCHRSGFHRDAQVPSLSLSPHFSWHDNRSAAAFVVQHHPKSGLGWEESFAAGLVHVPREELPKDVLLL